MASTRFSPGASTRLCPGAKMQRGQIAIFFALIASGLLLLMAGAWTLGQIAYARGEVGKAADAAALAAASRVDPVHLRETGEVQFLPDAYATAQSFAMLNAAKLQRLGVAVYVTEISANSATRTVYVAVAADLSSLLPGFLSWNSVYSVTGYSEAMKSGE